MVKGRGEAVTGEEAYRLEGVTYGYGEATALDCVDLTVERGECLAVLGANGSGKSTLLKLLNGLIFPDAGRLSYGGAALTETVASEADFRSAVGLVFHEPDIQLFCPTVYEELAFGPVQLGLGEEEVDGRVADVLSVTGLEGVKGRAPYELSGGEKKKVAIASVLTMNPGVVLMDEPTGGLDPRSQVWLLGIIEGLKSFGKTVVIATHDLSLAEDVADRVAVLDESHRVAAVGAAGEVLGDKELLLGVNLIHEHRHRHGDTVHSHSHGPYSVHDEHD